MQMVKRELAILITLAIGGIRTASAQVPIDKLQPLVETSARRLLLAKQVALAKWDSQAPVEDPAREAQVITAAVKDGEAKGLDPTFVSHFLPPRSRRINSSSILCWQSGIARAWRRSTGQSI